MIKHGYEDVIFAGGTEASITPTGIAGFTNIKALSQETNPNRSSIPFDKERNGFVMGEGAARAMKRAMECSCTAYKNVSEDEYYFKGHFPGNPIMPGVLMVEALAQTGAVAILSMEENKGKNALFGGINNLKMKSALGEFVIDGIDTNIDFLYKILENKNFINNNYDTSFISKEF